MVKDKALENYHPILQKLLFDRGINSEEEAQEFLNPDYEKGTHNPYLLKNMEKVVKRILKAIKKNEKICIYSDYDADGIPGAVILHDYFQKISFDNFFNYIPHREEEGFGLNKEALKEIKEQKTSLIITVDCGITGVLEVKLAKELGIDVIITDHHIPNKEIPKAFAIINPKQKGDKYPFKELCGAGLAYKLVQALLKKESFEVLEGWEKWLLDMVGIATISDMVPLVGENRVLARFGLKVLRKSRRPGLKAILKGARVRQDGLTEDDVAFVITPRINAASRMDKPLIAFKALSSTDVVEATEAAKALEKVNRERKGQVASMMKEIKNRLKDKEKTPEVIVVGNPKWKPGLLGLAAHSIADEFDKPAYVWGRGESKTIKGSFRSNQKINCFELTNALAKEMFLNFGGHTHAGGFDIENEKIHYLEEALNKTFAKGDYKIESKGIDYDSKLSLEDINIQNYGEILKLSPFGMGNPKPIFLFEEVEINSVERFGKGELHTKLIFQKKGYSKIESISFFKKPDSFKIDIEDGQKINLIASIEENNFMGRRDLRLRTVDIF